MTGEAATRLVWELAGEPAPAAASVAALLKPDPGMCAICAHHCPVTASADAALGANVPDRGHLRVPSSTRVCTACLWCASGKPPATLRMWTVVAARGARLAVSQPKAWLQDVPGLCLTNRANTRPVIGILGDPPGTDWVVSVAVSGQKHVIPYAHVNRGGGPWTIRVEDHSITATPRQWRHVHHHALELRRLGIPADAVQNGEPRYIKTRAALDKWRAHNEELSQWHNSPLLTLALWTITKETMQ